jgi:hypothetical protein
MTGFMTHMEAAVKAEVRIIKNMAIMTLLIWGFMYPKSLL